MSTDRQDAGLDRLVRAALRGETPPEGVVCPDADAVAAYAAGTLTARERTGLEPHLATCQRCQGVLAMLAAEAEADAVAPPAAEPVAPVSWWRSPSLGWLMPAGAVTLAAVLYVAVKPGLSPIGPTGETVPAASVAPGQTMAKGADTADVGALPAAKPMSQEARARAVGRSEVPAAAANEVKRADAAKAESGLALAEKAAIAPAPAAPPAAMTAQAAEAPSSRAAAAGAAAGNLAMAAPQEAREKAVDSAEAFDAAAPGLDALWRRADLVIVARAAAPLGGRVAKGFADVVVIESLKQPTGVKPDSSLSVLSSPAGETRIEPGAEYVLFLTREGGAGTPVRFVTIGATGIVRLQADRAEILAQLRRLSDAQKR